MRAKQAKYPHQVGSALEPMYIQEWDRYTTFSNVVTAFCFGNRRPVQLADWEGLRPHFEVWLSKVATADPSEYMFATLDNLMRAQFPNVEEGWFGAYQSLIGQMTRVFKPVTDYGMHMREILNDISLSDEVIMMPAFAYGRPYLNLPRSKSRSDLPDSPIPDVTCPGLQLAHCAPMIRTCLAVDLPRWSTNLIPKFTRDTRIEGSSAYDRPEGEMKRQREMIKKLAVIFYLYMLQPILFHVRSVAPFRQALASLIRQRENVLPEVLEALAWEDEAENNLLSLPVHDLISAATSGVGTTSANGHFGVKASFLAFPMDIEGVVDLAKQYGVRTNGRGFHESADIVGAYIDHLRESRKIENMRSLTWQELCSSDEWFTLREVSSALFNKAVFSEVGEVAGLLGWSNVTVDCDMVDYYGADFAMTDGHMCQKRPGHILYGFSPSLGLNNRLAYAYDVVINRQFNVAKMTNSRVGGSIEWSCLPVRGYLDTGTAEITERVLLPLSACMGEEGVTPRFLLGDEDDDSAFLRSYWRSRSPKGFLREWYPAVSAPTEGPLAAEAALISWQQTSWDAQARTVQIDVSAATMLSTYLNIFSEAGSDYVESGGEIHLAEADKQAGLYFYLRVPVKKARTDRLLYLAPTGVVIGKCDARGVIELSSEALDSVSLPYDFAALDVLIDTLKQSWLIPGTGGWENPKAFHVATDVRKE